MSNSGTDELPGQQSPALADPALLAEYVEQGWLLRVGCNYYADDLQALPQEIRERIRAAKPSKYGHRLDFYMKRGPRYKLESRLGDFLQ